jgi:hypothetical protein
MKNIANGLLFTSRVKRGTVILAACALFLVASQHQAHGQWKLASGFSNANASLPNEVDQVAGFTVWGDSLLGSAFCADDLLHDPGAAPDSLFLSTDHGQTWTDFAPYGEQPLVVVGNDFIGEAQPSPEDNSVGDATLSYSTDYGQTWTIDTTGWNINTGGSNGGGLASSLVTIGSTIFVSTPLGGVLQQSTPGATWTIDSTGVGYDFNNIAAIGQLVASGNDLFFNAIQNGNGEIYVSTNQGGEWSLENNGLPTLTSSQQGTHTCQTELMAASGSAVFAAVDHDTDVFGNAADDDTVDFYQSTSNGQNWTKQNSSILNWGLLYKFIAYNQDLFAGTDSGFYYSTNSGATWTQADQGLQLVPGDHANTIIISGGNIVIGTNSSGAWYRSLSDFGVSSVAASVAPNVGLNLALSENPASSSEVKVTYIMSDAGAARVELMDELGRSVRMLQNGPAIPGENTLTIDPLTLAAGTYFVRVTADGASAMQKLVITR